MGDQEAKDSQWQNRWALEGKDFDCFVCFWTIGNYKPNIAESGTSQYSLKPHTIKAVHYEERVTTSTQSPNEWVALPTHGYTI